MGYRSVRSDGRAVDETIRRTSKLVYRCHRRHPRGFTIDGFGPQLDLYVGWVDLTQINL